ncbi:MAG: PAS domain S-box protein [Thermodesulfobacteriota bacterium]
MQEPTRQELLEELAGLRLRLEEAEDTLDAIRQGDIDALVISTPEGDRVFTLKGADHSYRVLVETISEGAATLSLDGKILYANRRLAELLQAPLERVIGSQIRAYVAPQDQQWFEALLQLRREDNRGEARLKAANGREVPAFLSVSLLPLDDMPDRLCLVVTDLTEQKRQEKILAAGRLSQAILDQAEQAIVVLNDQGVITQASRAAQRLYDGNLLLQRFEEVFPLGLQVQGGTNFPEEAFPLTGVLQGVIYQGVEAVFMRESQEFHVLLNAGPLLDEDGAVLGGIVSLTDITARKQAEEALRTQALILESMAEGVTVTDHRGYILYTNPAFDDMFGYEPGELRGRHTNTLNHYPPAENVRVVKEILRQMNATGVWAGEFHNRRKDGGPFFTSARVSALELDDKKLFISVQEDITERKRAEVALRESREDLNRAQAVAHIGSWRLDVQKNELTWSEENHRIFGIPPGQPLTYEAFLGIVHPEDRDFIDRKWTAALAGEPYDIEHRIVVNGNVRWVRERAELEFDSQGRLLGGFGTTQDITEKKQAEEALRQSEARYRAIGELIPYGIWTAGPDGGWEYVSKSFLKMTGKTLEECQGLGWLHLLPYEDTQTTLQAWQQCLATGNFWDFEYNVQDKDGHFCTILSRGLPLADDQGRITSWVGINLDITERKVMEDNLRQAHDELERRVEERTAALKLANEELWGEIAERQQVEYRLRQSEARFTAFMQYLPGAAVMRDIEGRYIFANETWERLTGQKPGQWQEKVLEDIWPPPIAQTIKDVDFAILSTGRPEERLEEIELADGPHYFLTQRFPIPDESGLPYMVGSIALDITDRQRAEAALALERQRFFDLLENLPAFIYLQALDYSLRFANREFRQRFGEPNGGTCYTLMWGRDEPCPDCPTFSVFHTGEPAEWEWIAPDDRIYQVYDYPFTDTDGTPLVLEMGIDITDRKQAEMEAARQAAIVDGMNRILREALVCETEEQLGSTCLAVAEELTDSRFGFIDSLNEQGNFDALAFSNPGWEMCRISPDKKLAHLKNIQPVGLLANPLREGRALLANDPGAHPAARGVPEGHPPLTAFLGVPLYSGDQVIGLLGLGNKAGGYTGTDRETAEILAPSIVEALLHHRAEKDLKRSEGKLRYLADQLLTAQENERKRLAAELHDELGHALLALKLALSSIARDLLPTQENLKEELQNQLDYIGEVIEEVRRLYHDLSPGNVEDLGLTKALRTLVEDYADLLEDIDWKVDLANLDGFFSLPVQTIIYRLVQEALTNIGKHADPEQVKVFAAPTDARVNFVIEDNGVGFDMSEVLHSAAGLGLVAMEERLNMVGGTFEVWSQPDQGTRISFSIPTRPPEEGT